MRRELYVAAGSIDNQEAQDSPICSDSSSDGWLVQHAPAGTCSLKNLALRQQLGALKPQTCNPGSEHTDAGQIPQDSPGGYNSSEPEFNKESAANDEIQSFAKKSN